MSWSEQLRGERERKGKFDSARDEVLWQIGLEGWGNESGGASDSPTGSFIRVCIAENELAEIVDAFTDVLHSAELDDPAQLVGNWILAEVEMGFVRAVQAATEELAIAAFKELETVYENWQADLVEDHFAAIPHDCEDGDD